MIVEISVASSDIISRSRVIADSLGRSLRAPHFTAGVEALRGEVDLAAGGVLLLCDAADFRRTAYEAVVAAVAAADEPPIRVVLAVEGRDDLPRLRRLARPLLEIGENGPETRAEVFRAVARAILAERILRPDLPSAEPALEERDALELRTIVSGEFEPHAIYARFYGTIELSVRERFGRFGVAVNWPAIGSVEPAEARNFSIVLARVVDLAGEVEGLLDVENFLGEADDD